MLPPCADVVLGSAEKGMEKRIVFDQTARCLVCDRLSTTKHGRPKIVTICRREERLWIPHLALEERNDRAQLPPWIMSLEEAVLDGTGGGMGRTITLGADVVFTD
jgi:hypothetical protein